MQVVGAEPTSNCTMKKHSFKSSLTAVSACALLATPVALTSFAADGKDAEPGHEHDAAAELPATTYLIANMDATQGNTAEGSVVFTQTGEREVTMSARLNGLKPNSEHAIHIHEFGDISAADGSSAGGHYNPQGHAHGLPEDEQRHAGDLGNLQADASGHVAVVKVFDGLTLNGEMNPILGRAVVVHAGRDQGTQPSGDAGARIAVGVIGMANSDLLITRTTVRETTVVVRKDDDSFFERSGERLKVAGERTAEGLETVAEKTGDGLKAAAEKTKDVAEKGVEKVGEALRKTGRAIERAVV